MKADRDAEVGFNIPSHKKLAHAPSYEEEVTTIHDDEHARKRGFRGNLVGGSLLLGYTLQMLYRYFGEDWMAHGIIEVSYIGGGAIDGDEIEGNGVITEKKMEDSGVRLFLDVWLDNTTTGKKILVGKASCRVP